MNFCRFHRENSIESQGRLGGIGYTKREETKDETQLKF